MPRACPVELSRSPRYKDPRRKQTDATGLSRGVVTLASLQRSKEKTNGCHGLVPWSCHARLATKIQGENKRMPRACPVEAHVLGLLATNVKLHGTSPWHQKTLV